ncbi:hypothetical protein Cylst_2570 [Cylindrospermum stagnale PCC 7417]|uniref:Uncharacterized protein n=1 Tax=Cylindrospermum stagnale PCC 7417 TaxID=56107 RepID=K9WY94_9NOST|nr:hypothetical protein [Cylindrospermum stagnale]AFZ24776.1 hypothetical protein Cylst_2570 [Cylindrospermum stagnale PCC 7417]
MGKRNAKLDYALKLLRPLTGGTTPDLSDGTPLGFYQAVVSGKKAVEYGTRPQASQPGSLVVYALMPFAEPVATAAKAKVPLSLRAETAVGTANVTAALLNISKGAAETEAAVEVNGFVPAKVTISIRASGDGTPKTSKRTGRRYNDRSTASYTYPFGMKSTALTEGYKALKLAIATAIKGEGRAASFSPEIYR